MARTLLSIAASRGPAGGAVSAAATIDSTNGMFLDLSNGLVRANMGESEGC
jgi:hypothetical protein